MSLILQLIIVFIVIGYAIVYFIIRSKNNKNDSNCTNNCDSCDLYKHCKLKK